MSGRLLDCELTLARYSHTLLSDEGKALDVLPSFPSLFDDDSKQNQPMRATGTDATDSVPPSVLPLSRPERPAKPSISVHRNALSASQQSVQP